MAEETCKALSAEVTVARINGIHLRCCSELADMARKYHSRIKFQNKRGEALAVSCLNVLCMGMTCGSKALIIADGDDAAEAIEAFKSYFQTELD